MFLTHKKFLRTIFDKKPCGCTSRKPYEHFEILIIKIHQAVIEIGRERRTADGGHTPLFFPPMLKLKILATLEFNNQVNTVNGTGVHLKTVINFMRVSPCTSR